VGLEAAHTNELADWVFGERDRRQISTLAGGSCDEFLFGDDVQQGIER
jgi:hypothetical protein